MKLVTAFFRLIRWPNLVFIALTQWLFYYCIYRQLAVYHWLGNTETFSTRIFPPALLYLLILASVLIAAAGYIINDYFDINIDLINKPGRLVVDKLIQRRAAIIWHWVLSLAGIIISFYVAFEAGKWYIGLANTLTVLLLVIYSVSLKKKPVSGNVLISFLTAWVILVLFVAFYKYSAAKAGTSVTQTFDWTKLFRLTLLYAGFAFIVSVIREAVKDMEDVEGDARNGCRTLPVLWGMNVAKIYTAVWVVVLIAALLVLQLYIYPFGWYGGMLYNALLLIAPLLWLLLRLKKAGGAAAFHQLSSLLKAIILAGILSMIIFWRYSSNGNHLF
jgi:4-hydroxybenzoate polyprenyltransferase